MNNEGDLRICLMTGLAGTGKTTIAKSVAGLANGDGILGASFFCSRDLDEQSNIQLVFPTIAFQLSQLSSYFRSGVVKVMKEEPDITHSLPSKQFEKLIVQPITSIVASFKEKLGFCQSLRDVQIQELIVEPLENTVRSIEEKLADGVFLPDNDDSIVTPIRTVILSLEQQLRMGSFLHDDQFRVSIVEPLRETISQIKQKPDAQMNSVVEFIRTSVLSIQKELDVGHSIPDSKLKTRVLLPLKGLLSAVIAPRVFRRVPTRTKAIVEGIQTILELIKEELHIDHSPSIEQLKGFTVEFLEGILPFSRPVVIVVDALDECRDPATPEKILLPISQHIHAIPFLKFFLTSRPESSTRFALNEPSLGVSSKLLILHDVDPKRVNDDIRLFLCHRLEQIADRARRSDNITIPASWPSMNIVEELVMKASGLFIYASTVCKFVESPGDPREHLRDIINSCTTSTDGLDDIYRKVVDAAIARFANKKLASRCRSVVNTVILLYDPLPLKDFAQLLHMEPDFIRGILRDLHSVLVVPSNNDHVIHAFHASFYDFLTTKSRSSDQIYVQRSQQHEEITQWLFQCMMQGLKRNICEMDASKLNNEVEDFAARKKKYIGQSLGYACRYWADHLTHSSPSGNGTEMLVQALEKLIQTKVLYWIEVLSLLGDSGAIVTHLEKAKSWHSVCS